MTMMFKPRYNRPSIIIHSFNTVIYSIMGAKSIIYNAEDAAIKASY